MSGRVTVIIPTLMKCEEILKDTIKKCIWDENVEEIFIFDNSECDDKSIPEWMMNKKIQYFNDEDVFVNTAWNRGIEICGTEYYLLLNDDIVIEPSIIDSCIKILDSDDAHDVDLVTIKTEDIIKEDASGYFNVKNSAKPEWTKQPDKNGVLNFQGWFMFGRKEAYTPIPNELKYFFGDNLLYKSILDQKHFIGFITNKTIYHAKSSTVNELKLYDKGILKDEEKIFKKILGMPSTTIIIGTPSHDWHLHANYVDCLITTKQLGAQKGIAVQHIFLCGDALIQRARNDLFKMAYDAKADYLVFIDSDILWNPEDFFKLIEANKEMIAAPCRKKNDEIAFNVKTTQTKFDTDIIEVEGVGTGFMCISRDAIVKLYESSEPYKESHKSVPSKMVFDIGLVDGELYSEDIMFCKKWKDLGGKIYVDSSMTTGHVGQKQYIGNLKAFLQELNKQK